MLQVCYSRGYFTIHETIIIIDSRTSLICTLHVGRVSDQDNEVFLDYCSVQIYRCNSTELIMIMKDNTGQEEKTQQKLSPKILL